MAGAQALTTKPNGKPSDPDFRYDANAKEFPARKDLPQVEGTPPGALNLLTPERVLNASKSITSGTIIPLNLPLDVPLVPAFTREPFEHEIKILHPGVAYDDKYKLNTQSGTQLDGFRHFAHIPSNTFYNNTKGEDIVGPNANEKCSIHFWAEHGIAGRGVFLDFWEYTKSQGKHYDPWEHYAFSYDDLAACGKAQGIDIRPKSQGGDILPGDILLVRGGWTEVYNSRTPEQRKTAALREHLLGLEDKQQYAGVGQEEKIVDWLHDSYFSCVGGDMPSFEAWPSHKRIEIEYHLHEYLLACWGVPIGEMWDLEKLSKACKQEGKYIFFLTSAPANVHRGVSSHLNGTAIL
ncbi:hypothetical protein B7463_g11913, partial [Scytalidium lignicola]